MNHLFSLPDRQSETIKILKEKTGLSQVEIARRSFDFSLQEKSINEWIPTMSGQFSACLSLGRVE